MTNGSNHLGTYDPNQRDERTKLLAFLHLSLMVLGKIVTNVEKLLPLKLGFFSPSSSVEKLASIVSHFYKSLSSIVIPFTKECDIIFPNHLPNCYLTSSKTMDPTLLWPPGWLPQKLDQQLVREFGQSRCNPIGQRTKGSIFTTRYPHCVLSLRCTCCSLLLKQFLIGQFFSH